MKPISTEASERPNSFDERGAKVRIIPAEVKGYFRKRRDLVQLILIVFFLILPWTKINGMQSLQLDILHRRFIFFGVQFLSHDAPLIFFILGTLTLGLALVTALWGRVWCGWACPQTTFIDGVYRRIEILIEGKYIERRRLDQMPLNFEKAWKIILKWSAYIIVSAIIAHSFIAFFSGAEELLKMMQKPPHDNWGYFTLVFAITGILAFNFGWFREQFCIVMCPYGRFQSVLMDSNTVTVLYDQKRNDCVACQRCVQVCPTGIDIRHGVQLECIGCTACIDACDEIMRKVKKPEGLIRYGALREKARFVRPRTIVYSVLLVVMMAGFIYNYSNRSPYNITFVRGQDTPYQVVDRPEGARVINHFKMHVYNQSLEDLQLSLDLQTADKNKDIQFIVPPDQLKIASFQSKEIHLFIEAPVAIFSTGAQLPLTILIRSQLPESEMAKSVTLVGPQTQEGGH